MWSPFELPAKRSIENAYSSESLDKQIWYVGKQRFIMIKDSPQELFCCKECSSLIFLLRLLSSDCVLFFIYIQAHTTHLDFRFYGLCKASSKNKQPFKGKNF